MFCHAARSLQPRALICSCARAHGGADLEAATATGSACGEEESSAEETRPNLQAADAMFVCFRVTPAGRARRAVRSELEQTAQAMQLRPLTCKVLKSLGDRLIQKNEVIALHNLKYKMEIEFMCELDLAVRQLLSTVLLHCGVVPKHLPFDVTSRPNFAECDLYITSCPCQPFSFSGQNQAGTRL